MTEGWVVVILTGAATMVLKAAGPVILRERKLPDRLRPMMDLVPASLLAALVISQSLVDGQQIVVDARVGGLAVGFVGAYLRVPFLLTLVLAVLVTALIRNLLG